MKELEFGAIHGDWEIDALASILSWAFGFPAPESRRWLERGGLEHVRVARSGNRLLGGLMEVPMGQWFGGRSVPMLGVAGVAVAADARGQHVALSLMTNMLRTARKRGFALSTLYPATLTLYRAAGYELSGSYYRLSADCGALPVGRGALAVEALEPDDAGLPRELYRRVASERNGYLDRGDYVWQRVREPRGEGSRAFLIRGAGAPEGYLYLSQRGEEGRRELVVQDWVTTTPAATQRALAMLADHRSTIRNVVVHGTAATGLWLALSERVFRTELVHHWMVRVVDVERALTARGYPPLDASVDLEVGDALLPENAGRYRLIVSGGCAEVTRGGSGSVRLDIRALAALYSGFLSPAELVREGALAGDGASLARLAALFAGPAPAMCDFF